jgi:hypothetical protein
MSNCNKYFKEYNDVIKLTDARRKALKKSRKELRRKTREYFRKERAEKLQPKFAGQGSLLMDVIINPIPRYKKVDGEEKQILYYDVDDGIYFVGDENPEDRDSIEDYHKWVCEAIDGHTDTPVEDKATCVRTLFADGHNIDNPIYYQQGDTPELAHKKLGWTLSDPKAFSEWFLKRVENDQQLRKIVRCLKGWSDKLDFDNPSKEMPPGIVLTILASNNAVFNKDRTDIALKETLVNIEASLSSNFSCLRPTAPEGEDLLEGYRFKEYFMKSLKEFIKDSKSALSEKNERKSTELWRKHLSNRFPLGEDKDQDEDTAYSALGIAAMASKPFCR